MFWFPVHYYFGFIADASNPDACKCESCWQRRSYIRQAGSVASFANTISNYMKGK